MPLRRRPLDIVLVTFYTINAIIVTYIIDIEQIVIRDTSNFDYPIWPPKPAVEVIHWWGNTFDPLLMARPPWWQATIWIDSLFFGPFYFFAIYALVRRRTWIRVPALVWSGMMLSNVLIIMMEERFGPYAAPDFGRIVLANLAWFSLPLLTIWRMRKDPFPQAIQ